MTDKPKPETQTALDFHDCRDYIEKKYKIQMRDYAGRFKPPVDEKKPYLDFWHWIIDRYQINNDSFFNLYVTEDQDEYHLVPDWVKEILALFHKEFGEYETKGYLKMWVSW